MIKRSAEDPRLTRLTEIALALPETARQIYGSHATRIRLMLEICVAEVRKLAERSVSASLPQLMQSGVNHAADKREWKPCFDARGVPQPSV
jgi:hypothetical protein